MYQLLCNCVSKILCHILFLYNAIAIAMQIRYAAPTGVPVASKKTDLLAGKVQNTSLVLEPPELKSIF